MGWRCSGFKDDSVQSALALQQFAANARSDRAVYSLNIFDDRHVFMTHSARLSLEANKTDFRSRLYVAFTRHQPAGCGRISLASLPHPRHQGHPLS